eukprot:1986402-Amphidinium_carterae.1
MDSCRSDHQWLEYAGKRREVCHCRQRCHPNLNLGSGDHFELKLPSVIPYYKTLMRGNPP